MNAKHPSESLTILTDLVLPSETNPLPVWIVQQVLRHADILAEL